MKATDQDVVACPNGAQEREPAHYLASRRALMRAQIIGRLSVAPATSSEIWDNGPDLPFWYLRGYTSCAPRCRGHLAPEPTLSRGLQADYQRMLVALEREGVTTRVVLQGAQSHLWSLAARS